MKHLKTFEYTQIISIELNDLVKPIDKSNKYYDLIFKVTEKFKNMSKWECTVVWDSRKENNLLGMVAEFYPLQIRKLTPEELNQYNIEQNIDKYNL